MTHVHHSDFSLPQLRELLSNVPDPKHHLQYLKTLRTARSNQEHAHDTVHVSLSSMTISLKSSTITFHRNVSSPPTGEIVYKFDMLLPTDEQIGPCRGCFFRIILLCIPLAVCLSEIFILFYKMTKVT